MIRTATPEDAPAICAIYNPYITNDVTSFEQHAVSITDMEARMTIVLEHYPWLVYEDGGEVLGFAYASRFKKRHAYRYVAETTVYLPPQTTRKGIGTALYTALLEQLKTQGITQAVGCIALPNPASVALHEKLGYTKVAHFPKVGYKFDQWIDVAYWQKAL